MSPRSRRGLALAKSSRVTTQPARVEAPQVQSKGDGIREIFTRNHHSRTAARVSPTSRPRRRNGNVSTILLVDEHSECVVISHYGKSIRIDTAQVRAAGRRTQGVRLPPLDSDDKVAAAVVVPPEDKAAPPEGRLLQ